MSDGVRVDGDFVRFGSKSYAVRQITSVEVREHRKGGCAAYLWLAIAGVFLIGGLGMLADSTAGAGVALGIGLILLALGLKALRDARATTYLLMLSSAAAEVQALSTGDAELAHRLKAEIEAAVAAR